MSYIIYDYLLPGINQREVILKRLHQLFFPFPCQSITLLTSGNEGKKERFGFLPHLSFFSSLHPSKKTLAILWFELCQCKCVFVCVVASERERERERERDYRVILFRSLGFVCVEWRGRGRKELDRVKSWLRSHSTGLLDTVPLLLHTGRFSPLTFHEKEKFLLASSAATE